MKIIASDGKDGFNNVDECLAYETELVNNEKKEKEEREQMEKTKHQRYENIVSDYEVLNNKIKIFEKDYGVHITCSVNPLMGSIDEIIDLFFER